ncbi:BglG family transcription antiterminator [Youngiibacter fragilis]|uniref:Uncharacterized protein n=1 Tax=Youngiibacter fragilis 232.1 TaxID=994573 RepID=V7I8J0_9CLOT|nr:transcription antiterminator [Youngiibacter fragilis]ETA81581.1 hypothetical protein T472_0205800 [Youngiibacter fragilis 232.1]
MYITSRERSMSGILLESQHLFVSIQSLAKKLDVSTRTIQREVKMLEDTLAKFGLALEKKASEGIRLTGSEEGLKRLKDEIRAYSDYELGRSERSLFIFHELLESGDPLKTMTLSKGFSVSSKTLQHDLERFEEEIRNTRLSLIRKRGYGVELEGREKDKRMAFINMAMSRMEHMQVFSSKEGEFLSLDPKEKLLGIFDPGLLRRIEVIVLEKTGDLPYRLTDLSLLEVMLHTYMSVERVKGGNPVDRKKHGDGPEETAASLVFKSLQKELGMNFPEDEAYLLASVLRSAKRISETDIENVIGLTSLASVLIEDVTRTTGYFFSKDKKFLDALVSHLEPLFNRIAEGVFVPNPIKREIKEDYSVLFGTIGTVLKEKFPELEFSEDEIGFLTLHFASAITEFKEVPKVATLVVCTSGLATSRMLTKKLLMKFPQLTIIEQGSIRELHKMDPKDFDLIISTVGIHDAGFEYILVNPMLSSEDELKLEKVINRKLLSSTRKRDEGVKESKLSEQGLLKTIEIVGDAGQAVKEILEGFAISETDGSDISSVLRGIEGDLMILLGTDTANESISMLLEKENATGSGIPESDITLLHGRNSRLDRMIFRIYRNKAKVKVKGMDSKMMESGTFLLLLTPELLTGPRLEMVSALSVSLLEKDIRKTYEEADRSRMLAMVEKTLEAAYSDIIKRIWR